MNLLFIGDVFGEPSIKALEKHLRKIIVKHKVNFTIAQAENVSGRKGLVPEDYNRLKKAGIDAFTMGNHVWAKKEILEIINNNDIIRPYNIKKSYPGSGTRVFTVRGQKLRVSSFLGIEFNALSSQDWHEKNANNFFDAFDELEKNVSKDEFHLVDFHAEVTSEKNVFGLYVDGKVSAIVGTHTHVQTNDARILPKGTAYITDVGSTGPTNSAIGADYDTVYRKMRYNERSRFEVSTNPIVLNAVIIKLNKTNTTIETIYLDLR